MTIFALITKTSKKDKLILAIILYIYFLLYFYKTNKNKLQALIYITSKINIMMLVYILKLSLKFYFINIEAYKIDGFILKIVYIVLASF